MKEQNITVALRVRPINSREVRVGARPIARAVDKNMVVLVDPNRDSDDILRAKRSNDHCYMFDVAFGPRTTQREVYQETSQRLVAKVISGYNATVFAYGPTGAGKTYTMLGKTGEPGIMALTLNDLFAKMEENKSESRYHVTMAYLEIYNETIRNLLGSSSAGILDLREDARGATTVSGLTEIEVRDTREVMALLLRGNLRRTCEPTAANKTSSRSHAILKVTVEQQSRVLNIFQKIRKGVLFMIDLAGSERAANTQNRGQRMKEGAHINRSLLALANCINTLCSGGHYVNYRDSKLTRLLKDALSGNSFTVMIAHISPASSCYEESKNTLKYADRVKHLKTKVSSNVVEVGQHVSEYRACFDSMQSRIAELEQQLGCKDGEGEALITELRALLQREKEIRQEMVSLEHQLLLIAIERQKHAATIQDSDRGTASPSSLQPSTLSPLPTTLEDTGQTSLLFERPSNWFSAPDHMIQPPLDTEDIVTSLTQGSHDSHMIATYLTHDSHMTTDSTTEDTHDGHVTTAESSDNHVTSPDSPQSARVEDESEEVYLARTALAALQMNRRRSEARHKRLGRKLMEVQTKKSQHISSECVLHPHLTELCVALQLCSDLEEEGRQRELAMARASLQLGRQETALDGLLDLNQQLLTALQQYRTLVEERSVPVPPSLPPLVPLLSQGICISRRVERERRLPVSGRGLQLPTFAMLSARLCAMHVTGMAGPKSNLLIEDVTDGEGEDEELKLSTTSAADASENPLPSLPISSLPHDSSLTLPFSSSSSLPPIPHTTSLITPHTTSHTTHTVNTSHDILFPNFSLPAVSNPPKLPFPTPPTQPVTTTHSTSTPVETTLHLSKRMSARSILSKVTFTAPQKSVSRSPSTKSKYVYTTILRGREGGSAVEARGSDTIANAASIESCKTETAQPEPELDSNLASEPGISQASADSVGQPSLPAKSLPAVNETGVKAGWREGGRREREERVEVSLQSLSQLSLSRSTPVKVGGEMRRVAKSKFRPRVAQSSFPVMKAMEQRTKRVPIRAAQKPRSFLPILPKRKTKERQPLIPSKVTAGSHVYKMASPYLKTTAKPKSAVKRAAPKKTNSSHPVTKFKSPYHIPMAKTNKTRK